jgi:short subunit dehydrogenase-like uncharacterized protein
VLGLGVVQSLLKKLVEKTVKGPDESVRRSARMQLWGRVTDPSDRSQEGTLATPEGYELTVSTAVESVRRVLAGGIASGALTPSMAFGWEFITEIEGCDLRLSGAQT